MKSVATIEVVYGNKARREFLGSLLVEISNEDIFPSEQNFAQFQSIATDLGIKYTP